MSFSHGMARGLHRGYKNYTPWLTCSRDLSVPPGKGTKETCFKIMLKILSEGKDGVPQRSCGIYSIFINDHENGHVVPLSASSTNTKSYERAG